MRKKFFNLLILAVCSLMMFSCANMQRIGKNTTLSSSNKNAKSSSAKTVAKSNREVKRNAELSNSDIYAQSMKMLKTHGSTMTDYCISWIGTPYQLGGLTKNGVDCSGFVFNVYNDVFSIKLPRRSADMENAVKLLSGKNKMKEGDLVFFGKGKVNHVGIFITQDKFIHASSSKGVIVSSLEEKYWKENFRSCGHHSEMKQN
ncbi:MAG: C40 family peptidase [Bacteroidales bacterium]|nr:C40 family peptidase [Bacteroidales bacterium]